jgi:beta-galactosidase/beta-glucuronidase
MSSDRQSARRALTLHSWLALMRSPRLIAIALLAASLALPRAAQADTCGAASPWPPPFGFPELDLTPPAERVGPTEVTITRDANGFIYRVNGQPESVRGMGYNPQMTSLSLPDRRAVLERDFAAMHSVGVNTVFGWDPAEFDGLLLDVANEYGLGVAVPYDIDFTADLTDPSARATARAEMISLVERYRQHPALRMWAVGNEVLQRTVPPIWCSPESFDDASVARARSLAQFIVELTDSVHELDPHHPVIYRESEESYTSWLTEAWAESPSARPWLIYGVNAYTARLGEIIDSLPGRGIDGPVLVSEFAPWEGERGARSSGLRDLWGQIQARERRVIGAAVYVWYADGPETVDQRYGLVDAAGRSVDNAVETIAQLYGGVGFGR